MWVKIYFTFLFLSCSLLTVELHARESVSVDPDGSYFVLRNAGDTYNCGPLTAFIARKFADADFDLKNKMNEVYKARDLVSSFKQQDSEQNRFNWWKLSDIEIYLKFMGVDVQSKRLGRGRNKVNELMSQIENKKLLIVNVNMNDFPIGSKIGKPYRTFYLPGGWGHYLVIVGFVEEEDQVFFEVHDTYSPAGKNRLYSAERIVRAMQRYYPVYLKIAQGVQ